MPSAFDTTTADPYSKLYDAVAAEFQSFAPINKLVRAKNVINWAGRTTLPPQVLGAGDAPQLDLVPTNLIIIPRPVSCATQAQLTLSALLLTQQPRIDTDFLPLLFAITAFAHHCKEGSFLGALTWRGENFFQDVQQGGGALSQAVEPTVNRGVFGWNALIDLTFTMGFNNTPLAGFITDGENYG